MGLAWTDRGDGTRVAPGPSDGRGDRHPKQYLVAKEDHNARTNPLEELVVRHGDAFVGFARTVDEGQAMAESHELALTRAEAWKRYMLDNDPPKGP